MIDENLINTLYKDNSIRLKLILEPIPQKVKPIVIQQDVLDGYIIRYFVRQVNDINYIVEVDEQQYTKFKSNPRFIVTKFKWKIVGKKETVYLDVGVNIYGVEDMNRIEVANKDLTFGGLKRYISDYLEYWVAES